MATYVFCLGVDSYDDPDISTLQCAERDAMSLYNLFDEHFKFEATLLKERYTEQIEARIRELGKRLRPGDNFIFYFSGHGKAHEADQYFLLPGCNHSSLVAAKGATGGVLSWTSLNQITANEKWQGVHRIFIFDACRTHLFPKKSVGEAPVFDGSFLLRSTFGPAKVVNSSMPPLTLINSCDEGASAMELPGKGYGVFTSALIAGLKEALQSGKDVLLNQECMAESGKRMKVLTGSHGASLLLQAPICVGKPALLKQGTENNNEKHDDRMYQLAKARGTELAYTEYVQNAKEGARHIEEALAAIEALRKEAQTSGALNSKDGLEYIKAALAERDAALQKLDIVAKERDDLELRLEKSESEYGMKVDEINELESRLANCFEKLKAVIFEHEMSKKELFEKESLFTDEIKKHEMQFHEMSEEIKKLKFEKNELEKRYRENLDQREINDFTINNLKNELKEIKIAFAEQKNREIELQGEISRGHVVQASAQKNIDAFKSQSMNLSKELALRIAKHEELSKVYENKVHLLNVQIIKYKEILEKYEDAELIFYAKEKEYQIQIENLERKITDTFKNEKYIVNVNEKEGKCIEKDSSIHLKTGFYEIKREFMSTGGYIAYTIGGFQCHVFGELRNSIQNKSLLDLPQAFGLQTGQTGFYRKELQENGTSIFSYSAFIGVSEPRVNRLGSFLAFGLFFESEVDCISLNLGKNLCRQLENLSEHVSKNNRFIQNVSIELINEFLTKNSPVLNNIFKNAAPVYRKATKKQQPLVLLSDSQQILAVSFDHACNQLDTQSNFFIFDNSAKHSLQGAKDIFSFLIWPIASSSSESKDSVIQPKPKLLPDAEFGKKYDDERMEELEFKIKNFYQTLKNGRDEQKEINRVLEIGGVIFFVMLVALGIANIAVYNILNEKIINLPKSDAPVKKNPDPAVEKQARGSVPKEESVNSVEVSSTTFKETVLEESNSIDVVKKHCRKIYEENKVVILKEFSELNNVKINQKIFSRGEDVVFPNRCKR